MNKSRVLDFFKIYSAWEGTEYYPCDLVHGLDNRRVKPRLASWDAVDPKKQRNDRHENSGDKEPTIENAKKVDISRDIESKKHGDCFGHNHELGPKHGALNTEKYGIYDGRWFDLSSIWIVAAEKEVGEANDD